MDKKTKILKLHAKGLEIEEIEKKIGSEYFYIHRIIEQERRRLEMDGKDNAEYVEELRIKIMKKQRQMKDLIPYENEQARESFHDLEREITSLNTSLNYIKKK